MKNDKPYKCSECELNSRPSKSEQEKTDLMKIYFSMLGEHEEGFWVESQGLSMLPLFYRGVKVHIKPDPDGFAIGDIVVFHRDEKFIAHRLVEYDTRDNWYITKGDTLYFFDPPVSGKMLLGKVDFIRKRGRNIHVETDRRLAEISNNIGQRLIKKLNWLPFWLKFLYYFLFFIPRYFVNKLVKGKYFRKIWK